MHSSCQRFALVGALAAFSAVAQVSAFGVAVGGGGSSNGESSKRALSLTCNARSFVTSNAREAELDDTGLHRGFMEAAIATPPNCG